MPPTPLPWIARAYAFERHTFARALQSSFASTAPELIEEAINDAFLAVIAGEAGDAELGSTSAFLYRIAWRSLRGQLRRKAWRVEQATEILPDRVDSETPESAALASALAAAVDDAICEAARRFSKRDPGLLASALRDRVWNGEADGVVAARHGVRREMLNRARNDVMEQVRAAA